MPYTPLFVVHTIRDAPKHPIVPGIPLFEHEVLHYMAMGHKFKIKFVALIDRETMEIYHSLQRGEANVIEETNRLLETKDYNYHNNVDKA